MSPVQLANQQLLTAWISAIAAVAQAGGAISAIWASVVIAGRAERRAREAEQRAEQRASAAEAAALARAEAAERIALERENNRATAEQAAFIAPSLAALERLRDEILRQAAEREADYTQNPPRKGHQVIGSIAGPSTKEVIELVDASAIKAKTVALANVMLRIKRAVGELEQTGASASLATEWVNARRRAAERIQTLIDELRSFGA